MSRRHRHRVLTRVEGVPDRSDISGKPGMAHFANSGPPGTKCADCRHHGYSLSYGSGIHNVAYGGCAMYRTLMGKPGPEIDPRWPSCKYWSGKRAGEK